MGQFGPAKGRGFQLIWVDFGKVGGLKPYHRGAGVVCGVSTKLVDGLGLETVGGGLLSESAVEEGR